MSGERHDHRERAQRVSSNTAFALTRLTTPFYMRFLRHSPMKGIGSSLCLSKVLRLL